LKFVFKYDMLVLEIDESLPSTWTMQLPENNRKLSLGIRINGELVQIFVCPDQKAKAEWINQIRNAKRSAQQRKVFGVPLEVIMPFQSDRGGYLIPDFLKKAIIALRERALGEEGLFRLNGRFRDIEIAKNRIDHGLEISFSQMDVHVIANLIKNWLGILPTPLIDEATWNELSIKPGNADYLKSCLEKLPIQNKYILQFLIKFLREVASNAAINKMDSNNLSIIFAPLLFRIEGLQIQREIVNRYTSLFPILNAFIDQYPAIFSDIEKLVECEREKSRVSEAEHKRNRRKGAQFHGAQISEKHQIQDQSLSKNTSSQAKEPNSMIRSSTIGVLRTQGFRNSSLAITLGQIVKQGYLSKQGHRIKNWKIRWFVLKFKYLYYFANRKDATPKGVICLINARVETSSRKEFGFVVEIDGSDYLISARSAKDQCEWVKAIRECIAFLPT